MHKASIVSFQEAAESVLRLCVPYGFMSILFLLNIVFVSGPLKSNIETPFIMMMIFYWSIYRPTLIPPLLVFLIGISADLLSGFPVGLNAFVLLMMRKLVSDQRLFLTSQPFVMVWLAFIVVGPVALFIQWFLYVFINLSWTPFLPVVLVSLSGVIFFPVVATFLHLSHRVLPALHDHYSAVK